MVSSKGNNSESHIFLADLTSWQTVSRMLKPVPTERCLSQTIASLVFTMTGYPNIDLFATGLNNRLPMYVSPIPDSKALATDVLSISWDHIHGYAFPLFHVIPAILNKIHLFQCRIILVASLWPQRSWFPDLLQLVIAPPLRLPNVPDLLGQLEGRLMHQNPQMLALHVWVLSSNQSLIKSFRGKLETGLCSKKTFCKKGLCCKIDSLH